MDTTKRIFNIYTWNMINHEFLLGVRVLSKIQTNPDGCVWTWGIPQFMVCWITNKWPFIIIYHQSPMGLAIKKKIIKKHHPSPEFVGHATLPSHLQIASASLASSLATPVKLRSVASRKSLLLGKCLLYHYHMIVVVYVYIQLNYIV